MTNWKKESEAVGKPLDLNQSVHALCAAYPEMQDIMVSLGFQDIVKPGMLNTAGRIMTLDKGARMKKIPMETIIQTLTEHGFDVENAEGGRST